MGLSATQRFLVEANLSANAEGYFASHAVGAAIGYTALESDSAVRSLSERKMVIGLDHGQARLLAAGREMALQLKTKFTDRSMKAGS
jgi:hypothetical protein